MIKPLQFKWIFLCFVLCLYVNVNAQASKESVIGIDDSYSNSKSQLRGKNIITPGGGLSMLNGDYQNPVYENFGHIGYKRFLNKTININVNYKKYSLDFDKEAFTESGFMSFDLNVEVFIMPENILSPFIYIGSGIVTDNDLTEINNKIQAGIGVEYLINSMLGLTFLVDGNYRIDQELQHTVFNDIDDIYLGAMLGVNVYFGKNYSNKKRASNKKPISDQTTVINSNPILHNRD